MAIREKGTGEVYKSRKAMLVHERGESAAEERKQHGLKKGASMPADWKTAHGYMKGGAVGGKRGKNMVAAPGPTAPMVEKAGAVKLATGGAAKMKPHSTAKKK